MSANSEIIDQGVRQVRVLKQELDTYYGEYRAALTVVELNFQSELHKFTCIRLAGFLEQLFFVSIQHYVRATSSPNSGAFALSKWKSAPNLNPKALEALVGRFGSEVWTSSLDELIETGNFRGSLGALLKVRNDSAHGKSYTSGVSSVSSYKELVDKIYGWVLQSFLAK